MIPNLDKIKNLVFDFGGVLINIDFSLSIKAFQEAGIGEIEQVLFMANQNQLLLKLEKGEISPYEFRDTLRKITGVLLSDETIDRAWNALLLDIPEPRMRLLERLRKKYRIFLLSNTNKIHYDYYRARLEEVYGYASFNDLFEKAFFSFEMGKAKPDAEIYLQAASDGKFRPEETLFIDDLERNTKGAEKVGYHTYYLKDGEDITQLFE